MAAETLIAGAPQLVLSTHIEQDLNGEALQRAGVARVVKIHEPGAKLTRDLIEEMWSDDALASRAAQVGDWHREELLGRDALSICERKCLQLLGKDDRYFSSATNTPFHAAEGGALRNAQIREA